MPDTTTNAANNAADSVADMASRARKISSDIGSRVEEEATRLGDRAKKTLGAATDYVRDHDMNDMASDLNGYVKSHPTQALLGAAAVGFLAAVLLRRR